MTGDLGAEVLFRYIWQGRVRGAYPTALVTGTRDRILLYKADGSHYIRSAPGTTTSTKLDGSWGVVERVAGWATLIAYDFGAWHAVWLMWDGSGQFGGWYVNLEQPWRASALGYDTTDLAADIVVAADGTWAWKDREELDALVDAGAIAKSDASAALRDAERAIEAIEAQAGVFSAAWRDWRPPAALRSPVALSENWALTD